MKSSSTFVVVRVEDRKTGIRADHYVEVDPSFVHPAAWAANQEREKGYKVLWARVWNGSEGVVCNDR